MRQVKERLEADRVGILSEQRMRSLNQTMMRVWRRMLATDTVEQSEEEVIGMEKELGMYYFI